MALNGPWPLFLPFAVACGSQGGFPEAGPRDEGGQDGAGLSTIDGAADAGVLSECDNALAARSSVGCEYLVRSPESYSTLEWFCTIVALANDSNQPATATVTFRGKTEDISTHARLPQGAGRSVAYVDLPNGAIPPHAVAVLTLAKGWRDGPMLNRAQCPSDPVVIVDKALAPIGALGESFDIVSSRPLAAHALTADLKVFWGIVTPLRAVGSWSASFLDIGIGSPGRPAYQHFYQTEPSWTSVVATTNDTHVMLPSSNGGYSVTLNRGQVLTVNQDDRFVGLRIGANHPIGGWAGGFTYVPYVLSCDNDSCATDYGFVQAQIAPPWAWGNEYAAVRPRDRYVGLPEVFEWRLVGAVDGTAFHYSPSPPNGAPVGLQKGELASFFAADPFVVASQDEQHPFFAEGVMTGSYYTGKNEIDRRGGPAVAPLVSARDFASSYTFLAPSMYPETDLVVVRAPEGGAFEDVDLDCAGTLDGWAALGAYQYTRVALSRDNFLPQSYPGGTCDNGVHRITSKGRFGATLWGWGSHVTHLVDNLYTEGVGYAFTLVGPTRTPTNPIELP